MIISCPSCPQKLRVPEDLFGKPVKCPKCGVTFEAASPAPGVLPLGPEQAAATTEGPLVGRVVDTSDLPQASVEDRPTRRIRRDAEPSRGPLILTLGIVSIVLPVLGWIPGIVSIAMGGSDRKKIRAGLMDRAGADITQAGWICGIIGTCIQAISCLGCGVYMTFVMFVITKFSSGGPMPKGGPKVPGGGPPAVGPKIPGPVQPAGPGNANK